MHECHHQPWKKKKKKKKRQYGPFVYSYCPPPSLKNRLTNVTFHEEFIVLVSEISATNKNILIFGDFHFHFNKQENSDTKQLLELLNCTGLSQRVCQPTHRQVTFWTGWSQKNLQLTSSIHWSWKSPPLRSFSCEVTLQTCQNQDCREGR